MVINYFVSIVNLLLGEYIAEQYNLSHRTGWTILNTVQMYWYFFVA